VRRGDAKGGQDRQRSRSKSVRAKKPESEWVRKDLVAETVGASGSELVKAEKKSTRKQSGKKGKVAEVDSDEYVKVQKVGAEKLAKIEAKVEVEVEVEASGFEDEMRRMKEEERAEKELEDEKELAVAKANKI